MLVVENKYLNLSWEFLASWGIKKKRDIYNWIFCFLKFIVIANMEDGSIKTSMS